jgi:hypothetical protein
MCTQVVTLPQLQAPPQSLRPPPACALSAGFARLGL